MRTKGEYDVNLSGSEKIRQLQQFLTQQLRIKALLNDLFSELRVFDHGVSRRNYPQRITEVVSLTVRKLPCLSLYRMRVALQLVLGRMEDD